MQRADSETGISAPWGDSRQGIWGDACGVSLAGFDESFESVPLLKFLNAPRVVRYCRWSSSKANFTPGANRNANAVPMNIGFGDRKYGASATGDLAICSEGEFCSGLE
jgi:hypothetical protein